VIRDFLVRGAEDPLTTDVMGSSVELEFDEDDDDDGDTLASADAEAFAQPNVESYKAYVGRWVLNF